MAYCFVFPYFRLCPHRVILKPAETFKTEIPFCSFRIWPICRYIPLAPDQCLPTFYGFVTYKCCIQVVHGPAIKRTRDPNIEEAGGVTNVKDCVAVYKSLWKFS